MNDLERVNVKLRTGVSHPFAGREGSIPRGQWHPDVPPETKYQVRIKNHPATVKVARWMLDWQDPETREWIRDEMGEVIPQVLPPPMESASQVQEAVMRALGGDLGGPVIPTEAIEAKVPSPHSLRDAAGEPSPPPPAAHRTPRELAEDIVSWRDGEVSLTHEGVHITFRAQQVTRGALRAVLAAVIEQARADGAAAAGPGGGELATRVSELEACVGVMAGALDDQLLKTEEAQAGVTLLRSHMTSSRVDLLGRVNALETRSAELESKLRAQVRLGGN